MKNKINVIRAWKDAEYRATLTHDELKELPESPLSLLDEEMKHIQGGAEYGNIYTVSAECWGFCCSCSASSNAATHTNAYNTNGSYCPA